MTASSGRDDLARAARLAAMGELSASIAHEIAQPLGAILSNADAAELLLARDEVPLDELRDILADIRAQDLRAHEIIRRLRALLEHRETQRCDVDLHAALDDVIKLVEGEAMRRRIALTLQNDAHDATLHCDRVQLQQVLLNLLLNAMDAMRDTPAASRRVLVRMRERERDGCVELQVCDRGHGFAAHEAGRLFESFYTTRDGGMGMGLSIARSIVLAHGGSIAAAPRARGGAVFTVLLPRRFEAAVPAPGAPRAGHAARASPSAALA